MKFLKLIALLFAICFFATKVQAEDSGDDEEAEEQGSNDNDNGQSSDEEGEEEGEQGQTSSGDSESGDEIPGIDGEGDLPNAVNFETNSETEHMKNFKKISNDLKVYEDEYSNCLREIPDEEFTQDKIDECVGKNFIKVVLDIKYETLKIMARADTKARHFFIKGCYENAGTIEEFSVGCDFMERDTLDMLWNGLDFLELLEINKDKYLIEYGKIPHEDFKNTIGLLTDFSKEFFELLDEIDSHKEVTILRLKTIIDDRTKLILEDAKFHPDKIQPAAVHHTIEINEQLSPAEELPELQIDNQSDSQFESEDQRRSLKQIKTRSFNGSQRTETFSPARAAQGYRTGSSFDQGRLPQRKNVQDQHRFFNAGGRYAGLHARQNPSKLSAVSSTVKNPAYRASLVNRLSPSLRAQGSVPFKNIHTAHFAQKRFV
jgi:hypothetical protein